MSLNRFAALSLLLLYVQLATAAVTLLNTSLLEPARAVAYTGVNNIMTIRGDLQGGALRIERSGGPVSMRAGTSIIFNLKYSSPGNDTIRIYSGERLLLEKIYTVLPAGDYSVGLAGTEDTLLSAAAICKAAGLTVKMPGTIYRPAEKVTGFSVDVLNPDGRISRKFTNKAPGFSADMLETIPGLPKGAILVFHTIKTGLPPEKGPGKNQFAVTVE